MSTRLDEVERLITDTFRSRFPFIDLWRPEASGPGSFFEPTQRRALLRAPWLLGDDGNLLLAVVSALRKDAGPQGSWATFANEGVRVLGNLLHRAAADYGMHRLLILLILPESQEVAEGVSIELASARYTAGHFRTVMLPHCQQELGEFQEQFAAQLELFSPFPAEPFLEPAANLHLDEYVEGALTGGSYESSPFRQTVEQDVKAFLRTGAWPQEQVWPAVTQVIESHLGKFEEKLETGVEE